MTDNTSGATKAQLAPVVTRNVRAELARTGRTRAEAMQVAGVSERTWEKRMRDDSTWRLSELRRLSAWLGVSLGDLTRDGRR